MRCRCSVVIALLPTTGTAFTGKVKDNWLPSAPVTVNSRSPAGSACMSLRSTEMSMSSFGLVRGTIQRQQDRRLGSRQYRCHGQHCGQQQRGTIREHFRIHLSLWKWIINAY